MSKQLQQKIFISDYADENIRRILFDTCKYAIESEIPKGTTVYYYWTFLFGDYEKKFVTLVLTELQPKFIEIIAPQKRIDGALDWLKANNSHLKFGEITNYLDSARDGVVLASVQLLND